jgi:hypothetical protein
VYALSVKIRVRIFLFRMGFVRIRANGKASEVDKEQCCKLLTDAEAGGLTRRLVHPTLNRLLLLRSSAQGQEREPGASLLINALYTPYTRGSISQSVRMYKRFARKANHARAWLECLLSMTLMRGCRDTAVPQPMQQLQAPKKHR